MEYIQKKKITNNEALFYIVAIADHALATEYGLTKDKFIDFFQKKIKELGKIDPEMEQQALLDDMISFGLFEEDSENDEK